MNYRRFNPTERNKISPCFKCTDRKLNCHSNCNKYTSYKENLKEFNEKLSIMKQYCKYKKDKYGAISQDIAF